MNLLFFKVNDIPLCIYTTFSLSIYHLMVIWVNSMTSYCEQCCNKHGCTGVSIVCWLARLLIFTTPGVVEQDCMVFLFPVFWVTSILISTVAVLIYIPTNSIGRFQSPHILNRMMLVFVCSTTAIWLGGDGVSG
jgi:hypothetical protein